MKNVLILFGGVSSEHDVSVVSAKSVIENTPREKYNIIMLGITKDGEWFKFDGDVALLPEDKWLEDKAHLTKAVISPDRSDHGIIVFGENSVEKIRSVPRTPRQKRRGRCRTGLFTACRYSLCRL